MKLELKHLAPYLPYGLRYSFDKRSYWLAANLTYTGEKYDYGTLSRLTTPEQTKNVIGVKWDDDKNGLSAFTEMSSIYHKPILRPLSDLDKPGLAGNDHYSFLSELNKTLPEGTDLDRDLDFEIDTNENSTYMYLPLKHSLTFLDFLFEHHFDVFGLIDAGLAISIEALNKEDKS